jgi:superoxide dismutase
MLQLAPLPYTKDALAPFISENTLNFHYDKHHMGYLNNLRKNHYRNPWKNRQNRNI